MRRLTLLAPINSYTGYGMHAIQMVRDLERITGCHVAIRALSRSQAFGARIPDDIRSRIVTGPQPEPWEILLHPPNFCPTPGKRTVYFTMWESTRLPPMGREFLNRAELVVTPCSWCASCMSASGVDTPIRIVPLGIHPETFRYRPYPDSIKDLCVFGAAGRMAHGGVRKGLNEVIELFQRAFEYQDDVRLKVKCWPDCPVVKVNDPRIQVTQRYLEESELAEWFAGIHCFVSATKAEGWGLMQQQAMSVGRPVISINFGGVSEFFNSERGYEIPWRLSKGQGEYEGCGHWAEPDAEAIVTAMREVYGNRQESKRRGALASAAVAPLTWGESNLKLATLLAKVGAL